MEKLRFSIFKYPWDTVENDSFPTVKSSMIDSPLIKNKFFHTYISFPVL